MDPGTAQRAASLLLLLAATCPAGEMRGLVVLRMAYVEGNNRTLAGQVTGTLERCDPCRDLGVPGGSEFALSAVDPIRRRLFSGGSRRRPLAGAPHGVRRRRHG